MIGLVIYMAKRKPDSEPYVAFTCTAWVYVFRVDGMCCASGAMCGLFVTGEVILLCFLLNLGLFGAFDSDAKPTHRRRQVRVVCKPVGLTWT